MNKVIGFTVLAASILCSATALAAENNLGPLLQANRQLIPYGAVSKDGYFKDIYLAGNVKVVTSFGNIRVQIVNSFPDLKVKLVENFPDFTVQFVESFPDIKIQFVNNFPGVP